MAHPEDLTCPLLPLMEDFRPDRWDAVRAVLGRNPSCATSPAVFKAWLELGTHSYQQRLLELLVRHGLEPSAVLKSSRLLAEVSPSQALLLEAHGADCSALLVPWLRQNVAWHKDTLALAHAFAPRVPRPSEDIIAAAWRQTADDIHRPLFLVQVGWLDPNTPLPSCDPEFPGLTLAQCLLLFTRVPNVAWVQSLHAAGARWDAPMPSGQAFWEALTERWSQENRPPAWRLSHLKTLVDLGAVAIDVPGSEGKALPEALCDLGLDADPRWSAWVAQIKQRAWQSTLPASSPQARARL